MIHPSECFIITRGPYASEVKCEEECYLRALKIPSSMLRVPFFASIQARLV